MTVYGALWFMLVIAVTAFSKSSDTDALTLTGAWLALMLVIPSSLNLLASTIYPVPSRVEMIQALRTASDEAQAEGSHLLARYCEDHPELAADPEDAMNDFAITRMVVAEEVDRRVQPVLQRYEEQLTAQQTLVDRFRFLSPAVVTLEALNDIAGTGAARRRHFTSLAGEFHEEWQAFFAPRILNGDQILGYDDLPVFRYEEESFAGVIRRIALNGFVLLVPTVLLGFAGFRKLRKYSLGG